jgi:hypothetical protein
MSDREAFEKWWPSVGQTIGKVAAWEAWQAALQSGESSRAMLDAVTHGTGITKGGRHVPLEDFYVQQSGEPVVFTCHGNNAPAYGCNTPGDMSGTYYKAPQPVVDRKCSECGNGEPDLSLYCVRCLNNDGWHLDENWTPQPVVDVNQKLVEALQAVLDCGSTSDQWWIDKARESLLSAGKETDRG